MQKLTAKVDRQATSLLDLTLGSNVIVILIIIGINIVNVVRSNGTQGALVNAASPGLVVIASCSVLMAPLGAKAAHALPVKKLKRAFACTLYVLAIYMFYKGVVASAG